MIQKIDSSPAFHVKRDRRTYLPSINNLACSKAVLENINLSFLSQNHSSVTRLKQFVYGCQKYNTIES